MKMDLKTLEDDIKTAEELIDIAVKNRNFDVVDELHSQIALLNEQYYRYMRTNCQTCG